MNPKAEQQKPESSKMHAQKKKPLLLITLALVLVCAGLILSLSKMNESEAPNTNTSINKNSEMTAQAKLTIDPAEGSVSVGTPKTIELWVDSGSDAINTVQAVLTYPAELVEVSNIEYGDSAFEIQAESSFSNGQIRIGRGQVKAGGGKQLVAKVSFVAKQNTGTALFKFTEESLVYRASDNVNILQDSSGASFNLQEAAE